MTQKRYKKVTSTYAKRQFTTIGLALIIYVLIVLYMPLAVYLLNDYAELIGIKPMSSVLIVGLIYVIVLLGTLIPFTILSKAFKIKLSAYWRMTKFSFSEFIIYSIVFLALGTALVFIISIVNMYIPIGSSAYIGTLSILPTNDLSSVLFGLLYCIALPIIEEVSFRGVLLRALGVYGNRFAMITGSIIYALLQADISSMIPAFFMSLFLINMTLRYRSVTPAIAVHIIFNLFMYGFEFIPANYIMIATGLIFVIYLLAMFFILTRKYIFAKVKKSEGQGYIAKLFYTRLSVIVAFAFGVLYMLVGRLG